MQTPNPFTVTTKEEANAVDESGCVGCVLPTFGVLFIVNFFLVFVARLWEPGITVLMLVFVASCIVMLLVLLGWIGGMGDKSAPEVQRAYEAQGKDKHGEHIVLTVEIAQSPRAYRHMEAWEEAERQGMTTVERVTGPVPPSEQGSTETA